MKVDKIIFGCDDNPDYLFYWEINARVCREVLEIEPVLFWITDEDSDFYHDGHGLVKKIKKLPDHIIEEWGQTFHSSAFQAQNVRLWGTKFFPEEVCLTSDIDLILFNKNYLDENVITADPDDFVILASDAYDPQRPEGSKFGTPRYAIPYLCGKGKTFCEILDLYSDYKLFIQGLALFNNGFSTDELYVGKMISEYTGNIKIHKKKRGASSYFFCNRRIEKFHFYNRESMDHTPKEDLRLDLSGYLCLDNYIDAHLPGPYDVYKEKVDNLVKYIFGLKKSTTNSNNYFENELSIFDLVIQYYMNLEKNLFIINIGAMDGIMFDTLSEYHKIYNFKGLFVEPIPYYFERLKINLKPYNYIFENLAISKYDGIIKMITIDPLPIENGLIPDWFFGMSAIYPPKNGLSHRDSNEIIEKWGKIIEVPCVTFQTLLNKHEINYFDIIQIDAEGHDFEIFDQIDIQKYRPKLIRLEWMNLDDKQKSKILKKFEYYDYFFQIRDGDIISAPKEILNILFKNNL